MSESKIPATKVARLGVLVLTFALTAFPRPGSRAPRGWRGTGVWRLTPRPR
jgi:hypothetical protein